MNKRNEAETIEAQGYGEPSAAAAEVLSHLPGSIRIARSRGETSVGFLLVRRLNPLDDLAREVFHFCFRAGLAPTVERQNIHFGNEYLLFVHFE